MMSDLWDPLKLICFKEAKEAKRRWLMSLIIKGPLGSCHLKGPPSSHSVDEGIKKKISNGSSSRNRRDADVGRFRKMSFARPRTPHIPRMRSFGDVFVVKTLRDFERQKLHAGAGDPLVVSWGGTSTEFNFTWSATADKEGAELENSRRCLSTF